MDLLILLEIIYLISAVLCAILVPLEYAMKKRETSGSLKRLPLKYSMTYGHIAFGFFLGLIPVINSFSAGFSLVFHGQRWFLRLDEISVVKYKEKK